MDNPTPGQLIRKFSQFSLEGRKKDVPRKTRSVIDLGDAEVPTREETGLTHECGVFGCIATGDWPSQIDVAQVICLGLVALQHRYEEFGKCFKKLDFWEMIWFFFFAEGKKVRV